MVLCWRALRGLDLGARSCALSWARHELLIASRETHRGSKKGWALGPGFARAMRRAGKAESTVGVDLTLLKSKGDPVRLFQMVRMAVNLLMFWGSGDPVRVLQRDRITAILALLWFGFPAGIIKRRRPETTRCLLAG